MMSSEIWGPGPFDNAIAQTWAFKLKAEHTSKTLPPLVQRFCDGNGPTAKALDALRGHKSMKILWLRGARISTKEAAAFAKAHPKVNVDINTF